MDNEVEASKVSQIVVRVTLPLRRMIEEYVSRDAHMNISEFVRDACREKIRADAPDVYRRVFAEKDLGE